MNRFFFLVIISVLLVNCSFMKKDCVIKGLSGKCRSEKEVYNDSFHEDKNWMVMPIDILKKSEVSNKSIEGLNKTWIASHLDQNKILIGTHYIYWDLQKKKLKDDLLGPVYEYQ